MTITKLQDEQRRLAAVRRASIPRHPPQMAFDGITGLVRSILDTSICMVSLVDRDRQWFKSCSGLDMRGTFDEHAFCELAIRSFDPPFVVPDFARDPRFADNPMVVGPPYIRAYAGVPLTMAFGYNLGSFCVIDTRPRAFTSEQIDMLTKFARLVIDEIDLRQIASVDQLTGALSRRAWLEEARKTMARGRRHGREASLVLLDIDHFKQVNDDYGHPTGDQVLEAVARELQAAMREGDVLGRIGGEEFALILPETCPSSALEAAERFRQRIAGLEVAVPCGDQVAVTASFGIAALARQTATPETWLAKADEALYAAKSAGRNRCLLAKVDAREIA